MKPSLKLTVSNQRGGVAKTTTAVILARCFAERGKRVLLIDTDPQGSVSLILGVKPQLRLADFLLHDAKFADCLTRVHENIDLLASDREANKAEDMISTQMAREFAFHHAFSPFEGEYDC